MGGGHDTSLKSPNYPKMLKLLVLCWRPDFLHTGYFLGKMKNQKLIFINLTLLGHGGGRDTSLKSPNYPKMIKFLFFVLKT